MYVEDRGRWRVKVVVVQVECKAQRVEVVVAGGVTGVEVIAQVVGVGRLMEVTG